MALLPAAPYSAQASFIPVFDKAGETSAQQVAKPDLDAVLMRMLDAVDVMQREYYVPWVGTWPGSIDWTGAVMGTHVSAALRTLSEALARDADTVGEDWKRKANLVDNYFAQVTSYYFGENAVSIRAQAYDDILWVVLGWLEAVRFVDTHSKLHYSTSATSPLSSQARGILPSKSSGGLEDILANQTFFGNTWIPPFAHRARVFWELSTHGWDDEYCGGGMTWNPRLLPYKNAITNELYVAASASMYLYFPGDDNGSPFLNGGAGTHRPTGRYDDDDDDPMWPPRDPRHLKAAIDGYRWLATSDFTNRQGLIIDGFHISGYADPKDNNTACDERNPQIFTYNQGVVLTGARALWEATGSRAYLEDGHSLIRNVIKATGWDLGRDRPLGTASASGTAAAASSARNGDGYGYDGEMDEEQQDEIGTFRTTGTLPAWHGLGRLGVMEELCDASATCNQDALTFKGIFFHHLAAFCEPLSTTPSAEQRAGLEGEEEDEDEENKDAREQELAKTRTMHAAACLSYRSWLANNARAALGTRDSRGRFGMWWTAGLLSPLSTSSLSNDFGEAGAEQQQQQQQQQRYDGPWPTRSNDGIPGHADEAAVDYRNNEVPWDSTWRTADDLAAHEARHDDHDGDTVGTESSLRGEGDGGSSRVELKRRRRYAKVNADTTSTTKNGSNAGDMRDPNSRGAGRTVETQGGGVAVLRAYWSILAQQQ
ncbi:Glycosyl hydrolase family 76 [Microdochium nivale]|nr:Glycosyl hydrolase family 76 [Microdochium nivale]